MTQTPLRRAPAAIAEAPAGATSCTNAVFQQPWWLDALAPGRWDEVRIERGGRTVARLPYVVHGTRHMRILGQPPLTQTLGPWLEPSSAKPANALAEEMELLTALEASLPEAAGFVQQFSPAVLNALPFHWAGYRLEVLYTYRIHGLASEDALWAGLRGNIRRNIRKARGITEVRDDLGLDRFYDVWAKTFARQGMRPPYAMADVERLEAACGPRAAREMLFAQDERGRVHAVSYLVWDANAAYPLLVGADPELRASGAPSLLMWEAMARARRVTDVFDFEGSMIQPVERFVRAFGGRQAPYLRVTRLSVPARAALAARARWRRRPVRGRGRTAAPDGQA
jgi:hypothetical protein